MNIVTTMITIAKKIATTILSTTKVNDTAKINACPPARIPSLRNDRIRHTKIDGYAVPLSCVPILICMIVAQGSPVFSQTLPAGASKILQKISSDSITSGLIQYEKFGTKTTGTKACKETSQWLYTTYKKMGYTSVNKWYLPPSAGAIPQQDSAFSIAVLKEGTNKTGGMIILAAHYDTYGGPGVLDNGTGTVALMEMARVLKDIQPERSILFLHLCGEEQRAAGSGYHIKNELKDMIQKTTLIINIDMLAGQKQSQVNDTRLIAYDNSLPQDNNSASLKYADSVATLFSLASTLKNEINKPKGGSDLENLQSTGATCVGIHVNDIPKVMHTPNDTYENIEMESTVKAFKGLLGVIVYFAKPASYPVGIVHHSLKISQPKINSSFTELNLAGRVVGERRKNSLLHSPCIKIPLNTTK